MKFSIVTPAWNVGEWLPQTIESVLSQEGDFEIEYIVVTDPSKDNTVGIARDYEKKVRSGVYPINCHKVEMSVVELGGEATEQTGIQGKGVGMYRALNVGFAMAKGDIHAWIPGDDLYQQGAFNAMAKIFESLPDVLWAKGFGGTVDDAGNVIATGPCFIYDQEWLKKGVYGMEAYHVNQESVFWRAELWEKCGPFSDDIRHMGDYWLWLQFAKHTPLWSAKVPVSYFRKRAGQDSRINADRCKSSMWQSRGGRRPFIGYIVRLFFYPYYNLLPKSLRPFLERVYPALFTRQTFGYIAIENGQPVKKVAKTFVC